MNLQYPVTTDTCQSPGPGQGSGGGCPEGTPAPSRGVYSPIPSQLDLPCTPSPIPRPSSGCVGIRSSITLESGEKIAADQLSQEHKLLGFDADGQTRTQSVLAISRLDSEGVEILTEVGKLVCSTTHTVYRQSGEMCFAGVIQAGDFIISESGSAVNVLEVNSLGAIPVVSITCEPDHTFVVDGFRAHNQKPSIPAEILYL